MKPTHIEHLGIAVTSLEEAMPFFEFLTGGKCYSIEEVADQKVKTAFFKVGEVKIELLEATRQFILACENKLACCLCPKLDFLLFFFFQSIYYITGCQRTNHHYNS